MKTKAYLNAFFSSFISFVHILTFHKKMDKAAVGIKNRKCLWYQNLVMFFYRRKKKMNELYIYIKDQCEVKSQDITKNILVKITGVKEIMNKYFFLLLLLLLLLLLFSYFVPIFYLIGLFGDVN